MKIAVLGCSGGMGSLFTRYFLNHGCEVAGSDRLRRRGLPAGLRFSESNKDAVRGADFVLVAVPTAEIVRVAAEVLPSMEVGATLVEMASVKGGLPHELRSMLRRGKRCFLSVHPLFGPLGGVSRGTICVVGTSRDLSVARRLFPDGRLVRIDSSDHDRMMAFALSLVHLTSMAFASVVAKGVGVGRFERFAPPLAATQLNLGKAVLSSSPRLLGHIQSDNPFTVEVLSSMIDELERLKRDVARKDTGRLEQTTSRIAAEFRRAELSAALQKVYAGLGEPPSID